MALFGTDTLPATSQVVQAAIGTRRLRPTSNGIAELTENSKSWAGPSNDSGISNSRSRWIRSFLRSVLSWQRHRPYFQNGASAWTGLYLGLHKGRSVTINPRIPFDMLFVDIELVESLDCFR